MRLDLLTKCILESLVKASLFFVFYHNVLAQIAEICSKTKMLSNMLLEFLMLPSLNVYMR